MYTGKHLPKKAPKMSKYELYLITCLICSVIMAVLFIIASTVCVINTARSRNTNLGTQAVEEMAPESEKTALDGVSEAVLEPMASFDYNGEKTGVKLKPKKPIVTETPKKEPLYQYTEEELMAVSNMIFGEVSAFIYDKNMTEDQKNLVLQEWCCVAVNHIKMGFANDLVSLMSTGTGTGYYIWLPAYGTEWYRDYAIRTDADRYERCRENAIIAMSGEMDQTVPDGVIFADLHAQGSGIYKVYNLDTGYFKSTVYLSYK